MYDECVSRVVWIGYRMCSDKHKLFDLIFVVFAMESSTVEVGGVHFNVYAAAVELARVWCWRECKL